MPLKIRHNLIFQHAGLNLKLFFPHKSYNFNINLILQIIIGIGLILLNFIDIKKKLFMYCFGPLLPNKQ
jgi:hypothetical protein